ncbi:sugar transferase, partial [bacterium]|nr:sugar transferase [bacterium]
MRDLLKRALDIVASAIGLIILSPVVGVIAVVIALDSPGSVLFLQDRVGRRGRIFKMYKFRTMEAGAYRRGRGITSAGDPRITRVGVFLRSWKLDELPNLFNVLKGEM